MMRSREKGSPLQVAAPGGVIWTQRPGGKSTAQQLLHALDDMSRFYGNPAQRWNWWEEGRRDLEHDRLWSVLGEWDNGAPEATAEESEALAQAAIDKLVHRREQDRRDRAELVADSYDEDREAVRMRLLRATSDFAFFGHVLAAPANSAQRDDADRRLIDSRTKIDALRRELGDPDQIIDRHGYLPAERREFNLGSHIDFWRHPRLREWSRSDRRRFTALLKMPMSGPVAMCSECEAPFEWHEYDLSLRLFHPRPPAGSQAETISRLMPGWWERCSASTAYQIEHRWGGKFALPDFDGEQWISMLPPLLRTVFAPAERRPRSTAEPKAKPLAVISPGPIDEVMARLAAAQAEHPNAQLRHGSGDTWELWPS